MNAAAAERQRLIQGHQLKARIDWLQDHLNRLGDDPGMKPAVKGWRFELREKQLLLHELNAGKRIDDRAVRTGFNAAGALRAAHLRRLLLLGLLTALKGRAWGKERGEGLLSAWPPGRPRPVDSNQQTA